MSNTPKKQAASATYGSLLESALDLSESTRQLATSIQKQAKKINQTSTKLASPKLSTPKAASVEKSKSQEQPKEDNAFRAAIDAKIKPAIARAAKYQAAFDELASSMKRNGASEAQIESARKQMLLNAPNLGVSAEALVGIAAEASSAGVQPDEVFAFAQDAAKMAKAYGLSTKDSTAAMLKWRKAMGLSQQETLKLADAVSYVGDSMQGTDAKSISQLLATQGAAIKKSGLTAKQAATFSGAILSGSNDEAGAASASKSLLSLTTASDTQKTALEALGFNPETIASDIKADATGTTEKLLQALKNQAPDKQQILNEQLFGSDASAITPLLENLDKFSSAAAKIKPTADVSGSLQNTFNDETDTIQFKTELFKASIDNAKLAASTSLLTPLNGALDALNLGAADLAGLAVEWPNLSAALLSGSEMAKPVMALFNQRKNSNSGKVANTNSSGANAGSANLGNTNTGNTKKKSINGQLRKLCRINTKILSRITTLNRTMQKGSATGGNQSGGQANNRQRRRNQSAHPRPRRNQPNANTRNRPRRSRVSGRGNRFAKMLELGLMFGDFPPEVSAVAKDGAELLSTLSPKNFKLKPAHLKNVMRGAGKLVKPLGAAITAMNLDSLIQDGTPEQIGSALGDMAGGLGGASAGAAIGTLLLPGIGTALGGMIGGIAGGGAGEWIGEKVGSLFGDDEPKLSEPSDVLPPSDSVAQQVAQKAEDNRKTEINISIPSSSGNREQDEDMMDRLIEKMKQLLAGDGMASDNLNVRMDNSLNDRSGL